MKQAMIILAVVVVVLVIVAVYVTMNTANANAQAQNLAAAEAKQNTLASILAGLGGDDPCIYQRYLPSNFQTGQCKGKADFSINSNMFVGLFG